MEKTADTVGEILRKAREQKGQSIAQVHGETKISPEAIRALEENDLASFASEIYLKGFLRNYADHLGLDGNQLWRMISDRREGAPQSGPGSEAAYWDIENSLQEEKLTSPRIFRRFVLPALIILIVVLALLLVRENRKVKELSTSANTHQVQDGVIPHAGIV